MFRSRVVPSALLGVGVLALIAGVAMVHYGWHRTLGYGGLGIGVLFALVGAGLLVWTRRSPGASRGSGFRPFGGRGLPSGNRAKAIIAAAIIIGATLGTFIYSEYQLTSQSGGQFGIALNVDSASEVSYPDGSVGVILHAIATGGVPPYTYTAVWSDNVRETSTTGNFTRVFGAYVRPATPVTITAESSNSGFGYLSLTLPSTVPATSGQVSTRTLDVVPAQGTLVSQASSSSATTQSKQTTSFIALTNGSAPVVSQGSSTSRTGTSSATSTASTSIFTSAATTSQQNTAWTLVPTFPPSVFVAQNVAYLNVTYTNTSNLGVTAYVNAVVATGGGPSKHVGGPVISIGPGGTGGLYLEIGSLAKGSYTVTFYAANNSNNQQISESQTIQFTVQ